MQNTTKDLFLTIPVRHFINWNGYERDKSNFETLQEMEEFIFSSDWNYWESVDKDQASDHLPEALKYIKEQTRKELKGQNKIKPEDYEDEIKSDIHRALVYSLEMNAKDEWIEKYKKLVEEAIEKTADNIGAYQWEYVFLKDKESKYDVKQIKFYFEEEKAQKLVNDMLSEDEQNQFDGLDDCLLNLEEYSSYFIDNEIYQVTDNQREYIDYYGTLGNADDWMSYFKDCEETSSQIIKDAQEEKAKKDNKKHIAEEIGKNTATIRQILADYSTDTAYNSQILRQIGSIEATTKQKA